MDTEGLTVWWKQTILRIFHFMKMPKMLTPSLIRTKPNIKILAFAMEWKFLFSIKSNVNMLPFFSLSHQKAVSPTVVNLDLDVCYPHFTNVETEAQNGEVASSE